MYSVLPVVSASGILDFYMTQGGINSEKLLDFARRVLVSPL
jgi:hypothetical protein